MSGSLQSVYSVAVNSAGVEQKDTANVYFKLFYGITYNTLGFAPKTLILKYDEILGAGSGEVWLQDRNALAASGTAKLIYPGSGFIMQIGDELALDFDNFHNIYACCQSGSGSAALSWMFLA